MVEKRDRFLWELRVAVALVAVSALLFAVHFFFYKDLHHIVFWVLTDLAFLPLAVIMTTLFLDRLLQYRDRSLRLDKRNMLSGVFFSSLGRSLLTHFSGWDPTVKQVQQAFLNLESSDGKWDTRTMQPFLKGYAFNVSPTREDLKAVRAVFIEKMDFMTRLLENPNLLEHESFTDLLLAVLHAAEELAARPDLDSIPDSDLKHLAGDMKRAYVLLVFEWAIHLGYLKTSYPYLFSLAVRINPLDKSSSAIVVKA